MSIASLRSIFALNPPFANCSTPFFINRPWRMNDLPRTAAATALTPRITVVAMEEEGGCGGRKENRYLDSRVVNNRNTCHFRNKRPCFALFCFHHDLPLSPREIIFPNAAALRIVPRDATLASASPCPHARPLREGMLLGALTRIRGVLCFVGVLCHFWAKREQCTALGDISSDATPPSFLNSSRSPSSTSRTPCHPPAPAPYRSIVNWK